MRFYPSEPDIATVFNRIVDGDIDLQPDFQRNEVWSTKKQQRLVDTILRTWVIPPILLISNGKRLQVLDGQQRLASIRDFKQNKFRIDGSIEPANPHIQRLDGLRYSELPPDVAKAFDRTSLRLYEIADHTPEEPAEIFFRLNQPTALTSAERRNAFFGPVRNQIRELVDLFDSSGRPSRLLGFSNARMAYDDVIARFAFTLETKTLLQKVTEAAVSSMYRREDPLSDTTMFRVEQALRLLLSCLQHAETELSSDSSVRLKLNKAAFYSWLLFFARLDSTGDLALVHRFFVHFEMTRGAFHNLGDEQEGSTYFSTSPTFPLLLVFSDRATARVADVSSVVLRDFALWVTWFEFSKGTSARSMERAYFRIPDFIAAAQDLRPDQYDADALAFAEEVNWGGTL